MAGDDRVIHIGSFSKSVAPALRIGYLVADWPVMSHILSIKSDGGSSALEQMVLAEFCRAHFDDHVRALRKTLRRKVEVLMEALNAQVGPAARFEDPAGGIFLWVTMPSAVDTTRLTRVALESGVAINPGAEWMTDAVDGARRLRLCFAHPTHQTLRNGVSRLAEICHREFGVPAREPKGHR
jgi:2-aminoadipate transaminase